MGRSCAVLIVATVLVTLTQCAVDPDACSMKPDGVSTGVTYQVMPSPFKIRVSHNNYEPQRKIIVKLVSTTEETFRSFKLAAYQYPYSVTDKPVGKLTLLKGQDYDTEVFCKTGTWNGLKTADPKPESSLEFEWVPDTNYGHVQFRATFVKDDRHFWQVEKSSIVTDPKGKKLPEVYDNMTPPINVDGCGSTKGCYREPEGCIEPQCLYILTWQSQANFIHFELGGMSGGELDRYVAVGISDDTYMGDDIVMACAHNSKTGVTQVSLSKNFDDPKENRPLEKLADAFSAFAEQRGSHEEGRLRCRFSINRDLGSVYRDADFIRDENKYLLFAHGEAVNGYPRRHSLSVEQFPRASATKVKFTSPSNSDGFSRYGLAKAHGCLMIVSWVLFASIALLMTKYYKPMWPNSRFMFNQRYWFVVHSSLMSTMILFVIIGIILIFIEADGWSEAPDLPQRAHPILGIIIFVCVIINPIIALVRPSKDSKWRPLFNWIHWLFGTVANVLAIPQIFIGMDFGKVNVPWWATWILVIWVIVHIAIEITLEVHQCCTYKKNKERRKKWEHLKRDYPKQPHPEPEPAGRRFKCSLLTFHVIFTIIITLFMVIVIAVA